MKNFTYITTFVLGLVMLLGMSSQVYAQAKEPKAELAAINKAIRAGDAEALSVFFNTSVDVTVPSADKSFSDKQATFVIKDFFAEHGITDFEVNHSGQSGITHYSTGLLTTDKGEFDTTIFLKKFGDKFLITQIRFEN